MTPRFQGNFTQQLPIPEEGIERGLTEHECGVPYSGESDRKCVRLTVTHRFCTMLAATRGRLPDR